MRIFAYPTRYSTRSMTLSSKCANSVTDMITQSPYSLRSITTTLSEVPVTPDFGQAPCGADRVSVKNNSENSDCMHRSVAELADLPDCCHGFGCCLGQEENRRCSTLRLGVHINKKCSFCLARTISWHYSSNGVMGNL
jgi:hypothetical protein